MISIPEMANADSGRLNTIYHEGSSFCCANLPSTACTIPRTDAMASDAGPVDIMTAGQAIRHGVTLHTYLSVPMRALACLPA